MANFDWPKMVEDLPGFDWMASRGKGVRIALLDTGFDLSHPALKHLNKKKRLFAVGKTPFSAAEAEGNDLISVPDAHGTTTASLLAAKPAQTHNLVGFAPDSILYLIKTTSDSGDNRLIYLLNGLELAADLKADLVIVPQAWRLKSWIKRDNLTDERIDLVFKKLEKSGSILLSAVKNLEPSELFSENLPSEILPAANSWSINCAAWPISANTQTDAKSVQNLHFFVKTSGGIVCEPGGGYRDLAPSNSFATAILGGIMANFIGSEKAKTKGKISKQAIFEAISSLKNNSNLIF
jgi:hypothetical protein